MKASELVDLLLKNINEYGDNEVMIKRYEDDEMKYEPDDITNELTSWYNENYCALWVKE